MTDLGTAAIAQHEDITVATLSGEFDISNVGGLMEQVSGALTHETAGLVVDLRQVRYMDSSGIRVLFKLADALQASRRGMSVVLRSDSPLRRVVQVTNLHEVVPVCDSLEDCEQVIREQADERI